MLIKHLKKFFFDESFLISRIILFAGLFFLTQKLLNFYSMNVTIGDFYNKDNACWNFSIGNGLFVDLWDRSYLSTHYYPFFYIVGILYKISAHPFWMFLFETICQLFMLWPILKFSEEKIGKKAILPTLILLFGYYTFRRFNVEPVYGESLMSPLIAWIIYYLDKQKFNYVFILSLLMLFTKESAFSLLVMLGVYLIIFSPKRVYGFLLIVLSIGIDYFLIFHYIPSLNLGNYDFSSYYGYITNSDSSIFTKLQGIIKAVFSFDKIIYFIALFLPVGFLGLFSKYMILGIGILAQNLLSVEQKLMVDVSYHVSWPLIPIIFMASIDIYTSFYQKYKSFRVYSFVKNSAITCVALNLLLFFFLDLRTLVVTSDDKKALELIKMVPANAAVSASRFPGSHLCHRPNLERFPDYKKSEYVLIEEIDYFFPHKTPIINPIKESFSKHDYHIPFIKAAFQAAQPNSDYYTALAQLKKDPNYVLLKKSHPYYIYKKI